MRNIDTRINLLQIENSHPNHQTTEHSYAIPLFLSFPLVETIDQVNDYIKLISGSDSDIDGGNGWETDSTFTNIHETIKLFQNFSRLPKREEFAPPPPKHVAPESAPVETTSTGDDVSADADTEDLDEGEAEDVIVTSHAAGKLHA